jgi:hypothetical protein
MVPLRLPPGLEATIRSLLRPPADSGYKMIVATPGARPSAMGFGWMVVMTIAGGLAVVTST